MSFSHELCKVRRQSEGELGLTNDLDAGGVILSIFQGLRKKSIFYAQAQACSERFREIRTGTGERVHRDI